MTAEMEVATRIVTMAGTALGLIVFITGLMQYFHANAIRRYEKFHEMSVRFDNNECIQMVCHLLHKTVHPKGPPTLQDKEVFICFLEEIYFMMRSGIMKRDIALYSFGYYGTLAFDPEGEFWQGLDREKPFYRYFLEFCRLARSFEPNAVPGRRELVY
jgi:hypothetical protein